MDRVNLGSQGLQVSVEGLGCMGMSGAPTGTIYGPTDDDESMATIHRARDLGITLLDTADVYGPFHNEKLVGLAIAGSRDEIWVSSRREGQLGFQL